MKGKGNEEVWATSLGTASINFISFELGPRRRQMTIKPSLGLTTRQIARAKGRRNNRACSTSNAKVTPANVLFRRIQRSDRFTFTVGNNT
uniref:Uncharacterized protein n=1 Tax=Arundo donax TaxID=35708 RepID=A0A0A9HQK8_ARUDO